MLAETMSKGNESKNMNMYLPVCTFALPLSKRFDLWPCASGQGRCKM